MRNKNALILLFLSITLLTSLTLVSANSTSDTINMDKSIVTDNSVDTIDHSNSYSNNNVKDTENNILSKNIENTSIKNKITEKTNKTIKSDTTATAVSTSSQLLGSGNYYLTNDITLSKRTITGTFILDGKGHTITLTDKVKAEDFHGQIHIINTIITGDGELKLECGDVLIENCTFQNLRSDSLEVTDDAKDPIRNSDEKVLIRNCTFQNNREDSLKIKECEATIDKCNFNNCGVNDGVIVSKRATVLVTNTNITGCSAPAFYIDKGGSIYINNVFIDGVNQTRKQNTSYQYQIRDKDDQTGEIILPNVESISKINITSKDTTINQPNNIEIVLYDESSNRISDALLKITITDTDNKTVEIQKVTDNNGIVSINQTSLFAGQVNINVTYEGQNGFYTSAKNSTSYTVTKLTDKDTLALTIDSVNTSIVNKQINITISLRDINSNIIKAENISVYIDNKKQSPKLNNNTLVLTITPTAIGNINITAIYDGNDYYENTSASKIINITSNEITKKQTSIVMIDDIDGTKDGFFKTTTPNLLPIKFNVIDENNNTVNEGTITIIESYKTIGTINLSTGVRIYNYDTLSHPFGASIAKRLKINYIGTDNYEDSNNTFIIGIVRSKTTQKTNLTVSATNTTTNNNNTITITLKTNDNVTIKDEMITVNIDGTDYNYTTDSNGKVIITNYTSSIEKSNVPVTVNYAGNYSKDYFAALEQSTTFNVLKNPNIKQTKISIVDNKDDADDNIIRAETNQTIPIEVNVTDLDDNPVKEGIVTLKYSNTVLGTIDLSKTTICYYNPLEINIPAVTARKIKLEFAGTGNYDSCNNTFTLSIKRSENTPLMKVSINATNTTVGKTNIITAVLTGDGNPIANEKVILNIDGQDHELVTDNMGIVTYTDYSSNTSKYVKVIAIYNGNYDLNYMVAKNNTTTFYVEDDQQYNKTTTIKLIDTHDDLDNGKIVINNSQIGLIEFKVLTEDDQEVNKGLITLYDMSNNKLSTINLSTNNRTFTVNSLAINFSASKAGYFKLNYTGVDEYLDSNMKFMVSLIRHDYIKTHITVNATDTTVNQRNIITVKLTSEDGRAIIGEKIALKITDKTYYVTTNNEGIGQYKIFSYPMEKTLQVKAEYPGNTTKYYLESSNNTTFNVKKSSNISTDKTTSTLYQDKHDGNDDYLLDIYTDRLNKIEYIVVDVNGNPIKEGTATLYVNGLNKADSINMSTNNNTFIFNPLNYNYTSDMETTFTIYYTGVNGYENSLATIKTTIHKINNIPTTINLSASNTTINTPNKIKITLKANDIKLANQTLNIKIDNKNYNYTTDEKGEVNINYTQANAKNNILVEVTYEGDKINGLLSSQEQATFNVIDPRLKTTINHKILNITTTNATLNITIQDQNGKTINNQNITIKTNNKTINTNTKNNITLQLPTGTNNIQITYPENNNYYNSTKNITINIPKQKTTIQYKILNTTTTNTTLNITIHDEKGQTIPNQNITIKTNNKTINTNTKNNITLQLPTGTNNIQITYPENNNYYNSTKNITINIPKLGTNITLNSNSKYYVGDNQLTGLLTDENKHAVSNADINIKCNDQNITVKTDKNGKFTFNQTLKEGQNNITLTFKENNIYKSSNMTTNLNAIKLSVKIITEDVKGIIGDNITIKVRLVDENNKPVVNGKVTFKCKGLTLKEDGIFGSKAPSQVINVKNGIADVNVLANTQLRKAGEISVLYAGSNKYNINNQTKPINVSIEKRNASIVVKTQEITNQDTQLLIRAYVYDMTGNKKSVVRDYDDNFVIFKVNGITIKDSNNQAIKAKIINGVAEINYTVPIGLAGIYTNLSNRYYTVLAIFGSNEYNTDVRNTTTFKVNRSEIFFNNIKVTYNKTSKQINIISDLQDYHNNMLKGQSTVIVKINKVSYKENDKVKVYGITNGVINITLNAEGIKNIKEVMLVSGQRVGYLGGRQTTTNITNI